MEEQGQEKPGWSFHKEEETIDTASSPEAPTAPGLQPISWSASEYVSHDKNAAWYMVLAGVTAVICIVTYFISGGDLISVISIAATGILFGVLAGKKPRELRYTVDSRGISVGNKLYPY